MKLLSENMLRFGTKNLSESSRRNLTLESIMQTIHENGLASAVYNRLLTEGGNLDAAVLTNMQTEISNYNAAYKKAFPAGKMYLECSESPQPDRLGSDEAYKLIVYVKRTGTPGAYVLGKIMATQDLNGTIFDVQMLVYDKTDGNSGKAKIGQKYANDPALLTEPNQATITNHLNSFSTDLVPTEPDFAAFMKGNGQIYLVRAFMDAFKAIQVYPTSTRKNMNTSMGPQASGKPKGVNPYKKL